MRDRIKNDVFFNKRIESLENSISKRIHKLNNNLIKQERITIVKSIMASTYKDLLIAKYSRGDDMNSNEVINLYSQSVLLMYNNWKEGSGKFVYSHKKDTVVLDQYTFSSYLGILELISLGILLDISDDIFEKLIKHVERDNVKDFLLDYLFCYRKPNRKPLETESYEKFYDINDRLGRLKSIIKIDDITKTHNELQYFLEKEWYNSFKGTPLYNSHKNPNDIYVGYWCFVSAAIVKIKQLNDTDFQDNQYYPKDFLK